MSQIITFKASNELSAEKNLANYINFAKQHTLIADWESHEWDLTNICGNSKKLNKRQLVNFDSRLKGQALTPSFVDGAKALYSEFIRRKKPKEFRRQLNVLKMIEQVLIELDKPVCITQIDNQVLDEWARHAAETLTDSWTIGRVVKLWIDDYINPAKLTARPIQWQPPFTYTSPKRRDRLGKKNEEMESTKLPDINSIIALAEVASDSDDEIDKVVYSFAKLAMFAPSRISEILTLPVDCITQAQSSDGIIMGIKWRPVKGGHVLTKFAVNDASEEMARSAVDYLLNTGKTARKAAEWYVNNPDSLYLPEGLEHLRGQPVTSHEFSLIIGRESHRVIKATDMRSKYKIKSVGKTTDTTRWSQVNSRSRYTSTYSFEDVEKWVLSKIPDLTIDTVNDMKLHEALFCMPTNLLRPDAITLNNVPSIISISQVDHQLGNNPNGRTIFSRNNKLDDRGNPWKLTSHQFRHLLNTLAQSKYLNQSLIAFWSGRKSVRQNDWYNHLEQDAFIEAYTKLDEQTPEIGVVGLLKDKAEIVAKENMISYREALTTEIKSIHITRYGICRHDWALTPCPKDKDCINCGEHLFMKGEEKHLIEAEHQLKLHEIAVESAKDAVENNRPGAKRWLENNEPKLIRWRLAVETLNDPSIPDRTLISLPPPKHSQTQVGLTCKVASNKKAANDNCDDTDLLKDLGMI